MSIKILYKFKDFIYLFTNSPLSLIRPIVKKQSQLNVYEGSQLYCVQYVCQHTHPDVNMITIIPAKCQQMLLVICIKEF